MLSPLDCYELCVQSPRHVVSTLRAIHAGEPVALREDFCGTAAVSRRWLFEAKKRGEDARATAIDLDHAAIEHARAAATRDGIEHGLTLLRGDCMTKDAPAADQPADVIFVGNFSIGYIHRRAQLMGYLKRSLARLKNAPMGPGIFACDTYGGAEAFVRTQTRRRHVGPSGEVVHYLWTHEEADPIGGMVTNSISVEIEVDGEIVERLPRAFVYRWRLWSIAELREAMMEVGFRHVDVYRDVSLAPEQRPEPVEPGQDLGANWIVLLVGRA